MKHTDKQITIQPKCKRAKNRVREHGDTFWLVEEKVDKVLVVSLSEIWFGWFDRTEANWKDVL